MIAQHSRRWQVLTGNTLTWKCFNLFWINVLSISLSILSWNIFAPVNQNVIIIFQFNLKNFEGAWRHFSVYLTFFRNNSFQMIPCSITKFPSDSNFSQPSIICFIFLSKCLEALSCSVFLKRPAKKKVYFVNQRTPRWEIVSHGRVLCFFHLSRNSNFKTKFYLAL